MAKRIIQVEEKVPANLLIPLSIQHMFAMFGASVLVPFLFGINPAIVPVSYTHLTLPTTSRV